MVEKTYDEKSVREHYQRLTRYLIEKGLTITTMESATAGQIASLITDTEGSSAVLKGACVTYSNEAKIKNGVPESVIEEYSVYSEETAYHMAKACQETYAADLAIGVTGTMGNVDPANETASVPGQVYFAIAIKEEIWTYHLELSPQPDRLMYKLAVAEEIYQVLSEKLDCQKLLNSVQVNGINLKYAKCGQGRPLILIHGNGEDHSIFEEAAEKLKDAFTCYMIDSRGHGESTSVEEYHYQDMADDVIAFMEKLDLQDVAYYGFSDGGIIGLYAAMKSDRITDLIISGANINPLGVKLSALFGIKKEYRKTQDPKLYLMISEPDISAEQLQSITARTLVLAGEKDLIPYAHTRKIAKAIPGSTLRILRGETHGSYIVHSEKIAVLLRKWFHLDGEK